MPRGQILERKDGFLIRIYQGRDPQTHKRIYINQRIRGGKKAAEEALTKLLAEKDDHELVTPSSQTLSAFLQEWIDAVAKGRVSSRTRQDYRWHIEKRINPEIGTKLVGKLRPLHVQKLYTTLQARGLSPRSVRYTHAVLRTALDSARRWRLLKTNPCDDVDLPSQEDREHNILTPEQLRTFIEHAQSDRFAAVWVLLATTGMRPGEALGLTWDDVVTPTIGRTEVRIRRALVWRTAKDWALETPKTKRSKRVILLTASAAEALRQHRVRQAEERLAAGPDYTDNGLVFATRMGGALEWRRLTRRHFEPTIERAKLPRVRPYDLRHSIASALIATGENIEAVSRRLGHAKTSITLDVYTHALPGAGEATTEHTERLLAAR